MFLRQHNLYKVWDSMDKTYEEQQMEWLIGSSAWKMVCDYIQKEIDIETETVMMTIPKEYTKEQIELLHNRQEVTKSIVSTYKKVLAIPESIIQDNTGSWNFTVKL